MDKVDSIAYKGIGPEEVEVSWPAALEKIDLLESRIATLEEENAMLAKALDVHGDRGHEDLRARISKLESPTTVVSQEYVTKIKALLKAAQFHRLPVKTISDSIGVSKRHTHTILKQMERDRIINLINDPHHKQRKLAELHQQIGRRT